MGVTPPRFTIVAMSKAVLGLVRATENPVLVVHHCKSLLGSTKSGFQSTSSDSGDERPKEMETETEEG